MFGLAFTGESPAFCGGGAFLGAGLSGGEGGIFVAQRLETFGEGDFVPFHPFDQIIGLGLLCAEAAFQFGDMSLLAIGVGIQGFDLFRQLVSFEPDAIHGIGED